MTYRKDFGPEVYRDGHHVLHVFLQNWVSIILTILRSYSFTDWLQCFETFPLQERTFSSAQPL